MHPLARSARNFKQMISRIDLSVDCSPRDKSGAQSRIDEVTHALNRVPDSQ